MDCEIFPCCECIHALRVSPAGEIHSCKLMYIYIYISCPVASVRYRLMHMDVRVKRYGLTVMSANVCTVKPIFNMCKKYHVPACARVCLFTCTLFKRYSCAARTPTTTHQHCCVDVCFCLICCSKHLCKYESCVCPLVVGKGRFRVWVTLSVKKNKNKNKNKTCLSCTKHGYATEFTAP